MERRNRRHPQSTGKWFVPGPLHQRIFGLLQDYNYLSSTHISHHLGGYKNYLQRNLTALVSEANTPHKGPYLARPHQQQYQPNYLSKPDVYELTDRAYAWLKDYGLYDHLAYKITHLGRRGAYAEYPHELFADELLSSLALGVGAAGFEFVHVSRILAKAPADIVSSPAPLSFEGVEQRLTPDRLFGVKKSATHYDFFALEADRGTMPVTRLGTGSSIARKIRSYVELMRDHAYEDRLNLPNLRVLFITVSEAHARSVLDHIESIGGLTWLLVKSVPTYADPFRSVPPLPEIFATPWQRGGYPETTITD